MHINRRIERFLREHDMPPTKFGRLAAHDPRIVLDIRMGREIRPCTAQRISAFIDGYSSERDDKKWAPALVPKSRDNKNLERTFDSIKCHPARGHNTGETA